jgi:hypothetical protein
MEKGLTKYIYFFFIFLQFLLLVISTALYLGIQSDLFVTDVNTGSLVFRLVVFILFQIFLYVWLKKRIEEKRLFNILSLLSFVVVLDGVGNIFGLYDIPNILYGVQYDDILHFVIPGIMGFVGYLMFTDVKETKNIPLVLSFLIVCSLISIWEIYEYWSDVIFQTTMVPGLSDTILDMTLGVGGCLLVLLGIKVFKRDI